MAITRTTNIEFLTELMETSATGSLIQAFIIEAILHYARETLIASPWPKSTADFISQDAWKVAAKECLDAIEARLTI